MIVISENFRDVKINILEITRRLPFTISPDRMLTDVAVEYGARIPRTNRLQFPGRPVFGNLTEQLKILRELTVSNHDNQTMSRQILGVIYLGQCCSKLSDVVKMI